MDETDAELISNYYKYKKPETFENEETFENMGFPVEVTTSSMLDDNMDNIDNIDLMGFPTEGGAFEKEENDNTVLDVSSLIVSTVQPEESDVESDVESYEGFEDTSDDEFSVHTFGSDDESESESGSDF